MNDQRNTVHVDRSFSIGSWFSRLGTGISNTLVRIGRARAAAELAKQGYHREAKKLMVDND